MGFKRPFEEELQELPFKHPRQLDYGNKLTQFDEVVPYNDLQKPAFAGGDDGYICKPQNDEAFEGDTSDKDSGYACKGVNPSDPFPLVAKGSSDEEASGGTSHSSLSLECTELDIPRRTLVPFEDSYSFRLDRSPRKLVPLGPGHQANIPVWEGDVKTAKPDQSDTSLNDKAADCSDEKRLMGTCIIPMPDVDSSLSEPESHMTRKGRTSCLCIDRGSVRCVNQHVKEAREELIESLGCEKFADLGFYDMGEVVSYKWSEEEEQAFHDIVYSNPVSLHREFWKYLDAAFPYRCKKEIVSYYFNVFILRRRAVQNRSYILDIDSDDDEWHGSYGGSYAVEYSEEDDDSAIESPLHQDDEVDQERHCTLENREDEEVDDDSSDDGDDDSGDVRDGDEKATFSVWPDDAIISHADNAPGSMEDELNIEDGSCTSFELHSHSAADSGRRGDAKTPPPQEANREPTGVTANLQSNKLNGCDDLMNQGYLFEPCDTKVWDARFQAAAPPKGSDLLPTWNIVEEIFGQNSWDKKDYQ